MKQIFKIAFILLFTINVNSQITEIVPLNSLKNENGTYRKDLNNELPFWEGTWIGITDNKKYTFQFEILYQQMKRYYSNQYYDYEDLIVGKFKVEDMTSNQIIYNDLNLINFEDCKITGASIRGDMFHFLYIDTIENCSNSVWFILSKNNDNQITYSSFEFGDFLYDYDDINCQNQLNIPMHLPTNDFILTKQ